MVQAYVLIQTEVGKAAQVADEARKIPGVESADDVTGPYDVIVKASAENVDQLGKLVVARITWSNSCVFTTISSMMDPALSTICFTTSESTSGNSRLCG